MTYKNNNLSSHTKPHTKMIQSSPNLPLFQESMTYITVLAVSQNILSPYKNNNAKIITVAHLYN